MSGSCMKFLSGPGESDRYQIPSPQVKQVIAPDRDFLTARLSEDIFGNPLDLSDTPHGGVLP